MEWLESLLYFFVGAVVGILASRITDHMDYNKYIRFVAYILLSIAFVGLFFAFKAEYDLLLELSWH